MKNQPLVSVVIPTFNRKELLVRLVKSILKSSYKNLEIIIIDDLSTDGTYETIKKMFPKLKVFRNNKKLLAAGSRNVGIKHSKGEFIFLIDDDNVIDKNTISELVTYMRENKNIIASPIMFYYSSPSVIWCAGGVISYISYYMYHLKNINSLKLPQVIKCDFNPNCYIISKEVLNTVGYFDEKFPIYFEEVDFFRRANIKGFIAVTITSSKIWHDAPTNSNQFHMDDIRAYYSGRGRVLFYSKYAKIRMLFSFVDILYFSCLTLSSKNNLKNKLSIIRQYLRGALDGIKLRNKPLLIE